MKKIFVLLIVFLALLAAVLVYRAETVFKDRQVTPATDLAPVQFDQQAAVQRFSKSLTFPTISHDDRENFDAQAFLDFHDYLAATFPLVHRHAQRTVVNGYSLVYHLPGFDVTAKPVLMMGHMDVVPVEDITLNEWTHPPFSGTVADGIVWGRGSVDDKLTVLALMEAMEQLLSEGFEPARPIYFAFGHDEEVGGFDGAARIAEYFKQQDVSFEYVMDEGGAITRGMIGGIDGPMAVIGISEKGYVNLLLTVDAPGGHSSQPPAQTALGILSRAIVRVEDAPFPASLEHIYTTFEHIGVETPFVTRLFMANLWLLAPLVKSNMLGDKDSAAGIRTTTAATMASGSPKSNILPTRATAVINFRILPGETVDSVKDRVTHLIDDERVAIEAEFATNPSPVSPTDSDGYRLIASTIRGMDSDILVAPYMVRGGTDAKYFYDLSPNVYRFMMLRIDPETVRFIHGIDERVPVDAYLEAVRFNYHLLRRSAMQ